MTITAQRIAKYEWIVTVDGIAYRCPAVLSEADAIKTAQNAAKWQAYSAARR